jgi:hypothetical protein
MLHGALVGAGALWPLSSVLLFFPSCYSLGHLCDDQVSQGQTYEVFKRQTQEEIFS